MLIRLLLVPELQYTQAQRADAAGFNVTGPVAMVQLTQLVSSRDSFRLLYNLTAADPWAVGPVGLYASWANITTPANTSANAAANATATNATAASVGLMASPPLIVWRGRPGNRVASILLPLPPVSGPYSLTHALLDGRGRYASLTMMPVAVQSGAGGLGLGAKLTGSMCAGPGFAFPTPLQLQLSLSAAAAALNATAGVPQTLSVYHTWQALAATGFVSPAAVVPVAMAASAANGFNASDILKLSPSLDMAAAAVRPFRVRVMDGMGRTEDANATVTVRCPSLLPPVILSYPDFKNKVQSPHVPGLVYEAGVAMARQLTWTCWLPAVACPKTVWVAVHVLGRRW